MANRYYVVYQFEKDGVTGTGVTSDVVFGNDPPYAGDVMAITESIKQVSNYDAVLIIYWMKLADTVDMDKIAEEYAAKEPAEEQPAEE